jgi:hypothetical protein
MTGNPIDAHATTLFAAASTMFDERVQHEQMMCRIYEAYSGPDEANHNCLGCNLDAITAQISKFLRAAAAGHTGFSAEESLSVFAFLLNTLWERITDVFDIVAVPEGYRKRHYEAMYRMRRWANFFKHPKEYGWLVHHPKYLFEGTPEAGRALAKDSGLLVIEDKFLKTYYSARRVKGLAKEFDGYENKVVVLLPDVASVTERLCDCLANFVEVVTKNPVYYEILNDRATIANYFDNLIDEEDAKDAEQSPAAESR